jgi:hypothetical protein
LIVTDPILTVERRLADELVRLHMEVLGLGGTHVNVHLRDDTVIYLVDDLPELSEAIKRVARSEVVRVTEQVLGRTVLGPISSSRPAPHTVVVVLRLGDARAVAPAR